MNKKIKQNEMKNLNKQTVLKELRHEINETLMFFVECDLKASNVISQGTLDCFKMQKVALPENLKQFVKN